MAADKKAPEIRFAGFTDDWEKRKLGDVSVSWFKGKGLSKNDLNENNEGYPALHYADLYKFQAVENDVIHWTNVNDGTIIPDNSILFPASDVTPDGLARTTTLKMSGVKAGGDVIIGHLHDIIDSIFTSYQINTNYKNILPLVTGTTVKHINAANLSGLKIIFPEKTEQTSIGKFFQQLDNLIVHHQQEHDKTVNIKKAMLEKMFPKEGEKVPEIRFKGFSGEWEKKKLGDVADISSAYRVHKNEWEDSGVPFFRTSDVIAAFNNEENTKAFISDKLYNDFSSKSGKVKKGDILVTGGGTIAIPYLIPNDKPLYFKDGDLLWFQPQKIINSPFLYYFYFTPFLRSYVLSISHIGTIAHYTIEQAKVTPLFLPSTEEQQQIGSFFQQLDKLINAYSQEINKLKNIKKALLEKMFV